MNNEYRLKNIRILSWNADSLRNKKVKLLEIVTRYQIGIILISETQLKGCNRSHFPNYTAYRFDRTTSKKRWGSKFRYT
jgi:exonuclease III